MNRLILIVLTIVMGYQTYGQTFIQPAYQSRTNPRISIQKIEIIDNYTVVHFVYVAPAEYTNGGWACASPDMYLEDARSGKKHFLIRAKNIPVCTEKHYFKKAGEQLQFQLYFPKLHHSIRYINVIENASNGFNFYKVYLKPVA